MRKEIHDILTNKPEPTQNEAQSNVVEIDDSGEDDNNNSHWTNVRLMIYFLYFMWVI